MESDFLSSFANKPVRESSGSMASNRFDYQKNWSLCELLKLHSQHQDYLMVFEHHEDVVVFDSQESPSGAIFYQVKTKSSGNWTIGSLTKSDSKSQSILEKLFTNHINFKDSARKLVFTSNQPLSTKLRNGIKSTEVGEITFAELSDKDKETVQQNVEPNKQDFCDIDGLSKITTEVNSLRLSDHAAITKGKLVEFFESIHPESEVHVSLVYKTFFDEIRRKTNCEKEVTNTQDLIHYKSIGKSTFESMISAVIKRKSDAELWNEANSILCNEGFNFSQIGKLRTNWQNYIIHKMNVSDETHMGLSEDVRIELHTAKQNTSLATFNDISKHILSNILGKYSADYTEDYIQSAILYEALRDDPVPEIDKEFKEEAK